MKALATMLLSHLLFVAWEVARGVTTASRSMQYEDMDACRATGRKGPHVKALAATVVGVDCGLGNWPNMKPTDSSIAAHTT